jgi:hypothetical protein|tara:strand:- start:1280 stop:1564 length:285 start_codon:yes stop_codon:yes gene_type:complete
MYNNYTYVIVESSDIDSLNFGVDENGNRYLLNLSKDFLRYNVSKNKAIVKYQGNDPIWKDENENDVDFFSGKTKYSHEEILNVLRSSEWLQMDE